MPARLSRLAILVALAASCAVVFSSPAGAQPLPSDRVYVRFDGAVRVPGATLDPGEYLLVLGMPVAGQAMIDIYRARDSALVASCLGIETRIARPAVVTILEYPASAPPALRAWFHPGNAVGFEFVYGASEAKALYLASGLSVPFASFAHLQRDMVGTFAIAVSASPAVASPQPVGTAGTLPRPVQSLSALEHLEAARGALARQVGAVEADTRGRIVVLVEVLERLEGAYRARRMRDVKKELALTVNTLGSLLPLNPSKFSGMPPLDAETEAALERVRAHLTAFASFVR